MPLYYIFSYFDLLPLPDIRMIFSGMGTVVANVVYKLKWTDIPNVCYVITMKEIEILASFVILFLDNTDTIAKK